MSPPLLLSMPGNEALAAALARRLGGIVGEALVRRFPDGESSVRVLTPPEGRPVVLACTLAAPDDKLVPLLLLAAAAREAGATQVLLVAPYLAYMRQDIAFRPGETASARHFARWLSGSFDGLVTVDPHLHRIHELAEVYTMPTRRVRAAPAIADWLRREVALPLLVGPDEESAQWVADVARRAGAPFVVLRKTRHGDREVSVSVPEVGRWRQHTPVLVDDIVSTGRTMIETLGHLHRAGLAAPVCVAVHALFAGSAHEDLLAAGAGRIVSADTVPHASNAIALDAPLAQALAELLGPS